MGFDSHQERKLKRLYWGINLHQTATHLHLLKKKKCFSTPSHYIIKQCVAIIAAENSAFNANLILFEQRWATAVPLKTPGHISAGQHLSDIIFILMDRAEILALGWAKNLDERKYKHNTPNKVSYAIKPHKTAHLAMLYKVKLNGFQKILQISKFLGKPKLTVCLVQKYYTQQSSYSFFSSHPLLFFCIIFMYYIIKNYPPKHV